jgi:arsenite methyltransferase
MNLGKPDESAAIANYARLAGHYDASCRRIKAVREEAIALLGLRPGDQVLDVACGTGSSFALLHAGVAPGGKVVGVELSPDMCRQARERAAAIGRATIEVVQDSAERAPLGDARFDAVLFHYTHDVLRNPVALANIFAAVRPGARVAVAGLKAGAAWTLPYNLLAMFRARRYVSTFEGLAQPWSHLLRHVADFRWRSRNAGNGYVGWGRAAAPGEVATPSLATRVHRAVEA